MNKQRRKDLVDVIDCIDEAISRLTDITCEEQDAFDNLPEGLQMSSKGEAMEEAVALMDEISSDLEDVKVKISDLIG